MKYIIRAILNLIYRKPSYKEPDPYRDHYLWRVADDAAGAGDWDGSDSVLAYKFRREEEGIALHEEEINLWELAQQKRTARCVQRALIVVLLLSVGFIILSTSTPR